MAGLFINHTGDFGADIRDRKRKFVAKRKILMFCRIYSFM